MVVVKFPFAIFTMCLWIIDTIDYSTLWDFSIDDLPIGHEINKSIADSTFAVTFHTNLTMIVKASLHTPTYSKFGRWKSGSIWMEAPSIPRAIVIPFLRRIFLSIIFVNFTHGHWVVFFPVRC